MTTELNSLRSRHKDLENIIRKQDEIICKLHEDNIFIKSKLLSFENITPIALLNDLENKALSSVGDVNTKHGLCNDNFDSNTNVSETGQNNRRTNEMNNKPTNQDENAIDNATRVDDVDPKP
jgi:hypothetical protein